MNPTRYDLAEHALFDLSEVFTHCSGSDPESVADVVGAVSLEQTDSTLRYDTVGHEPSNPGVDSETRWNPE